MSREEMVKSITRQLENIEREWGQDFSVACPSILHEYAKELSECYLEFLFPHYFGKGKINSERSGEKLLVLMEQAIKSVTDEKQSTHSSIEIFSVLPKLKELLLEDAKAIFEGDPAASSIDEVIIAYPGFYAIANHRFAHEFYARKIPLVPRLISELSHQKTGIDIHPGARIGRRFAIDHGSGIVIGETTEIADDVRLYQGVTLGAKSILSGEFGRAKKGGKRHPNIGNRCVIYANATVLGGDTVVGDDCVIGGGVRVTRSVPCGQILKSSPK